MREKDKKETPVSTHREARRDYWIVETLEAGIMLDGGEVKSLRAGQASLAGSFARLDGDEVFLYNLYIPPYEMGNRFNTEPRRNRKLLLHRTEIERLRTKTAERGLVLIPLRLYFSSRGVVKVEIAVARGKKAYDKRTEIKKKAVQREIDRAMKGRNQR